MEEKVELFGNMSLTFTGQDSIDAEILMQSLSATIRAYKAALSATYDSQGAEIGLNIKAFAPGSVEVVLESVLHLAPLVVPHVPALIECTKSFLEIIKLKKELKGEKPVSVQQSGAKTEITNHEGEIHYYNSTVYNLYINNPSIDAGLSSLFGTLLGSERPAISFSSSTHQVQVEESEYDKMCVSLVDSLIETEYQKVESTVEDHLLLKSPDLIGDAKWAFYYDGRVIHAAIEDESFMAALRKGEIKLFAGIKVPVQMKIMAFFNQKLELIKKVYTIVKVTGDLIDSSEEEKNQLKISGFENE